MFPKKLFFLFLILLSSISIAQSITFRYSFNTIDGIAYIQDIDGDNISEFIEGNYNSHKDSINIYSATNGSLKYSIIGAGELYNMDIESAEILSDLNGNNVKEFVLHKQNGIKIIDPSTGEVLISYNRQASYSSIHIAYGDFDGDSNIDLLITESNVNGGNLNSFYTTNVQVTAMSEIRSNIPNNYKLLPNYPNPFNPSTTIQYEISKPENVRINIYDVTGRLVQELVNENKNSGKYTATWNGRDNSGNVVASGSYFYQIISGDFVQAKKMILLK